MIFNRIPGTKDILPEEIGLWQNLEATSRSIFSLYNYKEIRTPLIEPEPLFNRSLGESAEIVQKQMFLIKNKEDAYALRPEGTASIVRAYIENNLDKTMGFAKLYYMGPMFRMERPQRGRLRQFHHIGAEAIGSYSADLDVEVISLLNNLLNSFSITGYLLKINSLGCVNDKINLAKALETKIKEKISSFCDDCKVRFNTNVLRILDCKNPACQEMIKELSLTEAYLCPDCQSHFLQVKNGLDNQGIKYIISPYLVRGLDYYTRTVFEVTHDELGSQDALGAGGRYDNLVHQLGGPELGAIGFALGVERLMLVTRSPSHQVTSGNLVFLITLGQVTKKEGAKLLSQLRNANISADTDYEAKSLKGAMRRANDLKARFVLILGEDELKKNVVSLKDMVSGEQREVQRETIINELTAK